MLGPPKTRDLDRSVAISLERVVPPDHFYRTLHSALDLTFVRDWVKDCYADRGRPSIDPVVFFKLQLIMFFEGIRSERKLVDIATLNLAHRWYVGYNLDEPLPDRSSLTRIRQRLGLPVFRRFFEHIIDLRESAGLLWGEELLADATKVQGNAAMNSLVPRLKEVVDEHLVELFEDETGYDPEEEGAGVNERWDLLEECRLDPQRPATGSYERIGDRKVSRTDPDAKPIQLADGRSALGYQDHYLVDGGRARIILHAFVTPGDVAENNVLIDQLRRTLFRRKLRPHRVVADARYGTAPNIRDIEQAGVRAYIPLHEVYKHSPYFRHDAFTYDPDRDVYRCPQGQELGLVGIDERIERRTYRGQASVCGSCPIREQCTTNTQGRVVTRSFHAEYLDRVRDYYDTPAYQKAMRKRGVWIEPLFAEAKGWHGLRRFRLRGLTNLNIEGLLIAAGQNLKRYLAATGRGPRDATGSRSRARDLSIAWMRRRSIHYCHAHAHRDLRLYRLAPPPFSPGWVV